MKLLFDQNISYKVALIANEHFLGSVHVGKVGLTTASDKEIIDYAVGYILLIFTFGISESKM